MLKRLGNFSMMTKIVIPTAIMLVVALGIVALAERGLGALTAQTHEIINVTARRNALSLAMTASVNGVAAKEKNAMLMTDQAGLDVFASAYVTRSIISRTMSRSSPSSPALPARKRGSTISRRRSTPIMGPANSSISSWSPSASRMRMRSRPAAQDARERLIALIKGEVGETTDAMQHADAQADRLYRRTFALVAGLSGFGLVLAFFAAQWITTRAIVWPLRQISDAMEGISRGDFSVAIEEDARRDEIGVLGRAFKVFRARSLALRENSQNLEQAHEEIRALNAVLERRVEERTAELNEAHRALLVKERLSSIGELTATVAHELRNPLSTLRNTLHVIGQTAAARDVDIERQLGRCARTIDRCDGIVGDLLDFANNRELHAAPARLDTWLDAVLDPVEMPRGIELRRALAAPQAVVSIDSERLRCAVVNLIENAVEAMADAPELPERRITVSSAESGEHRRSPWPIPAPACRRTWWRGSSSRCSARAPSAPASACRR